MFRHYLLVFVCKIHPQDDVFLCVLVPVGVDDNHVAHLVRPAALQPYGL